MVTHLAFIVAEEAVASVVGTYHAFEASLFDELEHLDKLSVRQLQFGLAFGSPEWEHRKQTPASYSQRDKEISKLRQVFYCSLVNAGDDVPGEGRMLFHRLDSRQHVFIA